ncbi:hypothetical protein PACTADRAFT_50018 [Pachysolen tannophilus NRRL Y-2460]|uniref:UspA domain-containing protein n=1 Tax=Pachysolen tannophilus NRRL Y-2460 TaxID=669874 RepID=A0A1E4TTZ5_PACTA|nr:hypothetical protein PACTADRAFT_50018 [Pachysolen tannophilus NRRL Y-2460]
MENKIEDKAEGAELKPVLKNNSLSPSTIATPLASEDSLESESGISLMVRKTPSASASASSQRSTLNQKEAIKMFNQLKLSKRSNKALYTKVRCPLPQDLEFEHERRLKTGDFDLENTNLCMVKTKSSDEEQRLKNEREKRKIMLAKNQRKVLARINKSFIERVSFDTIKFDAYYDNDSDDDSDYDYNEFRNSGGTGSIGRSGSIDPEEFFRTTGLNSPRKIRSNPSSPFNIVRPVKSLDPSSGSLFEYIRPSLDYPTRPIITNDSCTLAREHKDFFALYDKKVKGRRPVLPGRVVMVYINGRRHTWVALDWVIKKFLENGDRIVVIASVNPIHGEGRRSFSQTRSRSRKRGLIETKKNTTEHIKDVALNILKYCLLLADENLIVKINVELSVGTTKVTLKDMFKLYHPTVIVTGTKRNIDRTPMVAWNSAKVTDRLVSRFPIPVIMVPSNNMEIFEFSLFAKLREKFANFNCGNEESKENVNVKEIISRGKDFDFEKLNKTSFNKLMDAIKEDNKLSSVLNPGNEIKVSKSRNENDVDDESDESDAYSSENDLDDSISDAFSELSKTFSESDSVMELKKACHNIEVDLDKKLKDLKSSEPSKDLYKDLLSTVSQASRQMGIRMAEIEKSDGMGAAIVRIITGLPDRKAKKSMLDVADDAPHPGLSRFKTAGQAVSVVPSINISGDPTLDEEHNNRLRPTRSSLKFQLSRTDSERRKMKGKNDNDRRPSAGMLFPDNSDPNLEFHRNKLQVTFSSPNIESTTHNRRKVDAEKDKIRSKFSLRSLFKKYSK